MGVPKFFKWISERYPLILQDLDDSFRPEFDNLYLDMNGIIHNCSHGRSSMANMTEEEMVLNIFAYIDYLFRITRPRKTVFMAIDGCAPRAKMNQQRARRFRSAKEAKENLDAKIAKGEKVAENPFDSNCITPGTPFMARLSDHLEYFVCQRMQTEKAWQGVEVILSGHQVPGEGEHKIMDYIRLQRHNNAWEPERSHCLYGLDADLIMLGLATHEPNFALLREEVKFGKEGRGNGRAKSKQFTEFPKFQLLYVSLVREYLSMEFQDKAPRSGFDVERVIDDFVFVCYFIGNDFLPHLPFLDIGEGSLDKLFDSYKSSLEHLDDYLTQAGEVDLAKVNVLLQKLVADEHTMLMEHANENDWWLHVDVKAAGSSGGGGSSSSSSSSSGGGKGLQRTKSGTRITPQNSSNSVLEDAAAADGAHNSSGNLDLEEIAAMSLEWQEKDDVLEDVESTSVGKLVHLDSDEIQLVNYHHNQDRMGYNPEVVEALKDAFYKAKFDGYTEEGNFRRQVVRHYIEGLVWVYRYYYKGCPSWRWFYPYHYAPLISDLVDLDEFNGIEFEQSTPFLPYQQLMSVLPRLSHKLLPEAYADLMMDPHGPIADFYPDTFEMDMDGKRNDWEAVILLPFIDEERLFAAMDTVDDDELEEDERARNTHGPSLVYAYDKSSKGKAIKATLPGVLPDLPPVQVVCNTYDIFAEENFEVCRFVPRVRDGFFVTPGYPVLTGLLYTHRLYNAGVHIHNYPSKRKSVVLSIESAKSMRAKEDKERKKAAGEQGSSSSSGGTHEEGDEEEEEEEYEDDGGAVPRGSVLDNWTDPAPFGASLEANATDLAAVLLGQLVVADWPYTKKARVVAVADKKVTLTEGRTKAESTVAWKKQVDNVCTGLLKKRGVNVPRVKTLVTVQFVNGVELSANGEGKLVYSDELTVLPLRMLMDMNRLPLDRFAVKEKLTLEEQYPLGSRVVYMGQGTGLYGSLGEVVGHHEDSGTLTLEVEAQVYEVADFATTINERFEDKYYRHPEVASMVHLSSKVLSKLLGHLTVDPGNRNVGLDVRDNRTPPQQCVGYTRAAPPENSGQYWDWQYSERCVDLLLDYKRNFNEFVRLLSKNQHERRLNLDSLGGNNNKRLKELPSQVMEFIKSKDLSSAEMVPGGSFVMSARAVEETEGAVMELVEQLSARVSMTVSNVVPELVRIPRKSQAEADNEGGLTASSEVYLGDRVMYAVDDGLVPLGMRATVIGVYDGMLDLLLDEPWFNASDLNGKLSTRRGVTVLTGSVLVLSGAEGLQGKRTAVHEAHSVEALPAPSVMSRLPKLQSEASNSSSGSGKGKGKHGKGKHGKGKAQQQQQQQQRNGGGGGRNSVGSSSSSSSNNNNNNNNNRGSKHENALKKQKGGKHQNHNDNKRNNNGNNGNKGGQRNYHQNNKNHQQNNNNNTTAGQKRVNRERVSTQQQLDEVLSSVGLDMSALNGIGGGGNGNASGSGPSAGGFMDVSALEQQMKQQQQQQKQGQSQSRGQGQGQGQGQGGSRGGNQTYGGQMWSQNGGQNVQAGNSQAVLHNLFAQNPMGQQQVQPQQSFQVQQQLQAMQAMQQQQQMQPQQILHGGMGNMLLSPQQLAYGSQGTVQQTTQTTSNSNSNSNSSGGHQLLFQQPSLDADSSSLLNQILKDMTQDGGQQQQQASSGSGSGTASSEGQQQQTDGGEKKPKKKRPRKKKSGKDNGSGSGSGNSNSNSKDNSKDNGNDDAKSRKYGRVPPQVARLRAASGKKE